LPENDPVARNDSSLGTSTSKLGLGCDCEKPPIWKSENPAGLLGVPQRLGRGDLHRLDVGGDDPEAAADDEVERRGGHEHDQPERRAAAEDVHVAPAQQVPAGHAEDDGRTRREGHEHRVQEGVPGELAAQQLPHVGELRLLAPVGELVADRVLHPGVGDEDEVGRQMSSSVPKKRVRRSQRASPVRCHSVCITATSGASPSVSGTKRKW
jgi:hypothetical protein